MHPLRKGSSTWNRAWPAWESFSHPARMWVVLCQVLCGALGNQRRIKRGPCCQELIGRDGDKLAWYPNHRYHFIPMENAFRAPDSQAIVDLWRPPWCKLGTVLMQAIVMGLYLGEFHLPFGCARMFGTVPLSCVPVSPPLSPPPSWAFPGLCPLPWIPKSFVFQIPPLMTQVFPL